MNEKYDYDLIDGERVPRLVINGNYSLTDTHIGGVHVESGKFILEGTLQGSLDIQSGATSVIPGIQHGSVSIGTGGEVLVLGSLQGPVTIQKNATLIIEAGGKMAGPIVNYGKVIIRGKFGGSMIGDGVILIEGDGEIIQPIIKGGENYYNF